MRLRSLTLRLTLLFWIASTVVLVALGYLVHPGFFGLSAFVGAGLVFAGVTDWCGMGLLLAKAPWNRRQACACRT